MKIILRNIVYYSNLSKLYYDYYSLEKRFQYYNPCTDMAYYDIK